LLSEKSNLELHDAVSIRVVKRIGKMLHQTLRENLLSNTE